MCFYDHVRGLIFFFFFFFFFNDTATTEIYTSFPTRRSSDLDEFAAHFLDPAQQDVEKPGALGVAEIVELARFGDAEARAFDLLRAWVARPVRDTRERIGRIEASRHGKDVARVVGSEGEDRDAIERTARRHN